jgi:hypothetical protein
MLKQDNTEKKRVRRGAAVMLVFALASALLIPAAGAQEDDGVDHVHNENVTIGEPRADGKTPFSAPLARVYGEPGDGYAVIAGGTLIDVCMDNPPVARDGLFFQRGNGTYTLKTLPGGTDIGVYVYKTDLGVFELFDQACGGFFREGIPIPPPIANGIGTIWNKEWGLAELPFDAEAQPPGRYRNSVDAMVVDGDGNQFQVNALANYRIKQNGEPRFLALSLSVTPK